MEDYLYITVFGDRFTGKTTLVKRITTGNVMDQYRMTLNVNHTTHTIYVKTDSGNMPIDVLFSDMPGQHSLFPQDKIRVDALILLFSLDNMRSFDEMKKWLEKMIKMGYGPRPMVIVGNKLDLEDGRIIPKPQVFEFIKRVVDTWKFEKYPDVKIPIKYLELSAKSSAQSKFETMIGYLAGESFKIIQQSQTGKWDYFYNMN